MMFFRQFLNSPASVGALAPSSVDLAREMVGPVDFATATQVVELGPGTGPFTALLYDRIADKSAYVGIELNTPFYDLLQDAYPLFSFYNDSAENLGQILANRNVSQVDAIICGIPWASLPLQLQQSIMTQVVTCLKPGGQFISFAYLQGLMLPNAWKFRRFLRSHFANMRTSRVVWNNFPPAFAYICTK